MSYRFEPVRLRAAAATVATAFPLGRKPEGINMLFETLARIDPSQAGEWAAKLSDQEIDLLCQFFQKAPDARTVLAICLILIHRGESRVNMALRHFLQLMPNASLLAYLRKEWRKTKTPARFASSWVRTYLDQDDEPALVAYLCGRLSQGELTLASLQEGFTQHTPLFGALINFIFESGREAIASLQPELAAKGAHLFLERGEDKKVAAYLNYYPASSWKLEFLENLIRKKGPPDEDELFYKGLESGALWALREKLFTQRISEGRISGEREKFWIERLHHIQSWEWQGSFAKIKIRPFLVLENNTQSQIFKLDQRDNPFEEIPMNYQWPQKMTAFFNEFVGWG